MRKVLVQGAAGALFTEFTFTTDARSLVPKRAAHQGNGSNNMPYWSRSESITVAHPPSDLAGFLLTQSYIPNGSSALSEATVIRNHGVVSTPAEIRRSSPMRTEGVPFSG